MAPPSDHDAVKILERTQVAPAPPGSVPTTSLPLTFFDIPWLLCRHMQRLFFYQLPHPTHHFLQTLLPNLKASLSLTLRHFFPFAGKLIHPPPPAKPHILFTDGDSVTLTVAECAADFDLLLADGPRAAEELHPFVPELPAPARGEGDASFVAPLMALQVSIFPNMGICIGVRFRHVAADGRAFHHFMKSWASVCKRIGDSTWLEFDESLVVPCHDRAAIEDPNGLEPVFLNDWWGVASMWGEEAGPARDCLAEMVRARFVLGQAHIERLKSWAREQFTNDNNSISLHVSSFVVTCALTWVCLTKSQEIEESKISNDNKPYYFIFVADCRNRLKFPIQMAYFGNCLSICFVKLKRKEQLGKNGVFEAVKAIGKRVGELENKGPLDGAEKWMVEWKDVAEKWQHVTVAGSAKLGVYDSDFGWGRPKRTELVQIDGSGAISLAENGDEKGGVEIGLALSRAKMSSFKAILEESLKLII